MMNFATVEKRGSLAALSRYAGAYLGSAALASQVIEASTGGTPPMDSAIMRFRDLHRVLIPLAMAAGGSASALDRLPPPERAALLLTTLEGFSYADVAIILQVSHAEVRRLVAGARERLKSADRHPLRIMILDLEPAGVRTLVEALCSLGHRVCGITDDAQAVRAILRRERADLLLAEAGGPNATEACDKAFQIGREHAIPVVFVTDDSVRLIERDAAPVLIVAKPFIPSTLAAVFDMVRSCAIAPTEGEEGGAGDAARGPHLRLAASPASWKTSPLSPPVSQQRHTRAVSA